MKPLEMSPRPPESGPFPVHEPDPRDVIADTGLRLEVMCEVSNVGCDCDYRWLDKRQLVIITKLDEGGGLLCMICAGTRSTGG